MSKSVTVLSSRPGDVELHYRVGKGRRGIKTIKLTKGLNSVSEEEWARFKSTDWGAALLKARTVEEVSSEAVQEEESKKEGSSEPQQESSNEPEDKGPYSDLNVKEAVEAVEACEDLETLKEAYEKDQRKMVKQACEKRAEQLTGD